jgi:hypothetical protein
VDVVWPDGSTVVIRPVGKWGVSAHIELAEERRGAVTGLLGNFDGNPGNDLAARGGKRIAYTTVASAGWGDVQRFKVKEEFTKRFFDALYDTVGDSWRISQPASAFDYAAGQSTKTFTDRSIPERPVDPDELAAKKRAAAEKICRARGVTLPGPLADCITDVAATGNAAFADDAFYAQQAAQVSFRRLAAGANRYSQFSLLETGDGGLHIAFEERTAPGTYRMVNVPLDSAGREGAPEVIDNIGSEPVMFAGPDGGARVEAAELPNTGPSGIYQYARGADGAWAALGPVATQGASYVGRPIGLFLGDGTLLSMSPQSGGSVQLFRNTGDGNPGTAANQARPDCYSSAPAITRDGASGAVWVAWVQWNCAPTGVFVEQIDPATLAPVGPPVAAPGTLVNSNEGPSLLGLDDRLALTGRPGMPGVFLAYRTLDSGAVRLWRIGDPTAKTIAKRKGSVGYVRLVAEPTGGAMWLGWTEGDRLWVDRTTAAGVPDTTPRPVDPPPGSKPPLFNAFAFDIAARASALDVVYGYLPNDPTPGALWHARIEP